MKQFGRNTNRSVTESSYGRLRAKGYLSNFLFHGSSIAILAGSGLYMGVLTTPAKAACGTNSGTYTAQVTCSNTAPASTTLSNSTVTIPAGGGAQDGFYVTNTGANSNNVTASVIDSTINNKNATSPSLGINIVMGSTSASGNVSLTMSGTNSVTSNGGNAVLANNRGSGNATIVISDNINFTSKGAPANDQDGVEATVHGGIASIDMLNAVGSINVSGGNGVLIDSLSANGTIRGNIGAGVTINIDNTVSGAASAANSNAGIYASTSGASGTVDVTTAATINTQGPIADAIGAVANAGFVKITNSGALTTTGNTSNGINASTSVTGANASGAVTVINSGAISTGGISGTGNSSNGILANTVTSGTGASGAVSVTNSGAITTNGNSSPATINNGIYAWTKSTGTGAAGAVSVNNNAGGNIQTVGNYSNGILATTAGSTVGTVTVNNAATITTGGTNADGINANSPSSNVSITNSGTVTTQQANSRGLAATAAASGTVTVISDAGTVATQGTGSYGISAAATAGAVNVTSGAVNTTGANSDGINAVATTGAVTVNGKGAIATQGATSNGIAANTTSGAIAVNNTGAITTNGAGSNGINATTTSGAVTLNSSAAINAVKGTGIYAAASGSAGAFQLNVQAGGSLSGLIGVDVGNNFSSAQISNDGIIGASTDLSIRSNALTTAGMTINNNASGVITGYMTLGSMPNTLNNAGIWNLRNFADTNGDLVPDTLSVATADFGSSNSSVVNNTGTIALLGAGSGIVQTLASTGQYEPKGYVFNDMSVNGPAQGQILGVQTFKNSGVIDLTANPVAGDVLVISGGHTAGQDGGGVFVANGGTLKLNVDLNDGNANSQSDVLVVDSTRMGTGATQIVVVPGIATGALTTGDGILLVEVLNRSNSTDGVFDLANGPIIAGAYQYRLYRNGLGADGSDGNWYLRNILTPTPPEPPGPPGPNPDPAPNPAPAVVPDVQPGVPTAMVIPPLAIEYGYSMLGTWQSRVGETWNDAGPVYEERSVWCKGKSPHNPDAVVDPNNRFKCIVRVPVAKEGVQQTRWARSGWARLIGDRGIHDPDNFWRRGPDYDYTFGGIQAGLDIFARQTADGMLDKAGIYVGYGQIASNVKDQFGAKAGHVDMDAYTLAGYWTHMSPQGWYTDAVVQGTWYATDAKSVAGQNLKPDGFGILGSLEAGYSFKLGSGWTLDPQAQIVYENVNFDDAHDPYAWYRFQNDDSLRGRLGLRLTKTWNAARADQQTRLVTSWVRANMWHEFMGNTRTVVSTPNGLGAASFNSPLGGTWGEIEAGITAQATSNVNLFANGGYQHSLDNKGHEGWSGRLGASVKW